MSCVCITLITWISLVTAIFMTLQGSFYRFLSHSTERVVEALSHLKAVCLCAKVVASAGTALQVGKSSVHPFKSRPQPAELVSRYSCSWICLESVARSFTDSMQRFLNQELICLLFPVGSQHSWFKAPSAAKGLFKGCVAFQWRLCRRNRRHDVRGFIVHRKPWRCGRG
jgi:hypothetical protein